MLTRVCSALTGSVALVCLFVAGCARPVEPKSPAPADLLPLDAAWPKMLSELGLFTGELAQLQPTAGVIPYELNAPGFFDDALVQRHIRLPKGKSAVYKSDDTLEFPLGTIIAQTLIYPLDRRQATAGRRITETRLMVRETKGWVAAPYVWNAEQTDAKLTYIGKRLPLEWLDDQGASQAYEFPVPDANGCKRCHKVTGRFAPIALSPRQLNRALPASLGQGNQLTWWQEHGLLTDLPPQPPRLADWRDAASGSVEDRARGWLEVNCAHCHNPLGAARNSGLHLGSHVKHPPLYGVYKTPVAAGRGSGTFQFDIVPGQPDQSILNYRIGSTQAGIVMPEFGRGRVDAAGVALVREWIAGMAAAEAGVEVVGDVRELSAEQTQDWVSQAAEKGDAGRGELVFLRRDLSCVKCHALGGVGGHVGPELLARPQPLKAAEIVESVLLPAKTVKEGYATITVNLDDGRALSGIKVREDAQTLVLRDPVRGDTAIPVATIEDRAEGGTLMPTGVVARLAKGDLLDLVQFLSQLPAALDDSRRLVRRWEALGMSLAAAAPPTEESLRKLSQQAELPWETCYARLGGELPLDTLTSDPGEKRVLLRAAFELSAAVELRIALEGAAVQGWVIGSGVRPVGAESLPLPAGRHELWLYVDRAAASGAISSSAGSNVTVRCELVPTDGQVGAVRLVGDEPPAAGN